MIADELCADAGSPDAGRVMLSKSLPTNLLISAQEGDVLTAFKTAADTTAGKPVVAAENESCSYASINTGLAPTISTISVTDLIASLSASVEATKAHFALWKM